MIEKYIEKLIINLPKHITSVKKPLKIDLILDGGMFNGSYLIGAMYFLKEMERLKYIKIEKISGCSIGSIMGFLYLIDSLHLAEELYGLFFKNFKEERHLTLLTNLHELLKDYVPQNICSHLKNRFYVTYYNMKSYNKITRCNFKDINDIIHSLIKSCFVPLIINGSILYKNKYMDGINPHIFHIQPKRKILYLDLYGYDKICNMVCIKNEKTNIHRILTGMLDIHTFFIKQTNTQMCSYVNNWNIINKIHHSLKEYIEKLMFFTICLVIFIKKHFPIEYQDHLLYKMISNMKDDIYNNVIDYFCV